MSIAQYWRNRQSEIDGEWCHEEDREALRSRPHSFNLDHPVSPFIGDIENAPVVMLMANAGYGKDTYKEFFNFSHYLDRVNNPATSDWTGISNYYETENYWPQIRSGKMAILNACAYRSPRISLEPENRIIIQFLPSCRITRSWMTETLVPLVSSGERLIVAKRRRQWGVKPDFWYRPGIIRDRAPVSKHLAKETKASVFRFLASLGP